jgi:hypothetical protein
VTILRDLDLTVCSVQAPSALASQDEDEEEGDEEPEVIGEAADEDEDTEEA